MDKGVSTSSEAGVAPGPPREVLTAEPGWAGLFWLFLCPRGALRGPPGAQEPGTSAEMEEAGAGSYLVFYFIKQAMPPIASQNTCVDPSAAASTVPSGLVTLLQPRTNDFPLPSPHLPDVLIINVKYGSLPSQRGH